MKPALIATTSLLAFATSSGPQEDEKGRLRKEVIAKAEALPKLWEDARFWIVIDGRKCGWVRWQVGRQEFAGEPCLVVDYERATYLARSERHRLYVKPDEFISPRAFRYGESWREFRVENGKVGKSPFGAPVDPGNLVSHPEIFATLLPFLEGVDLRFSTMDHDEKVHAGASIKYSGKEELEGGGEGHKFEASFTVKPGSIEERNEMELWVRPDRTLARARATVTWTSGSGKKGRRVEVLTPVDPKEWGTSTIEMNEIRALAQLSALGDMYRTQRASDLDGNGRLDEWVGDVSGLYRIVPAKATGPIQVISKEAAMADAAPLPSGPEKGGGALSEMLCPKPVPLYGYLFKVLDRFEDSGKMEKLNDGSHRHEYMFAVCAYPAEYGKTGRKTFIIHWAVTPYWKDLKGRPAEAFPEMPQREGWQTGVLKK